MKKLLLPVLLCTSTFVFAQAKKDGFIKKYLFAKLSPTLFIPKEGDLTPAVSGTLGIKLHRYVAVGFSAGYFNYNVEEGGTFKASSEKKGFVPLGIDVTLTDFNAKKIAPIVTAQLLKPTSYKRIQQDSWQTPNPVFPANPQSHELSIQTTGKSLFSIAAGATIPLGSNRLALTAGYSQLTLKKNFNYSTFMTHGIHDSYKNYKNIPMVNVSLSFIF